MPATHLSRLGRLARPAGAPAVVRELCAIVRDELGAVEPVVHLYRPAWDDFQALGAEPIDRAASEELLADARALPLREEDGDLVGLLTISDRTLADADCELLSTLGAYAAIGIRRSQELEREERRRAALAELLRVSSSLTEEHSRETMLAAVCSAIAGTLGFRKVAIELVDPEAQSFRPGAAVGWDEPLVRPLSPDDLQALLDPAFELEGCYLVPQDEAAARVPQLALSAPSELNSRGPHAWHRQWLLVPLQHRNGGLAGVIWVDDPENRLRPSRTKLQSLRLFATQATSALDAIGSFEAVSEARDGLGALIDSSPLAIFELDAEGVVRSWNPAAERLFGWRADEVVGGFNPIVPAAEHGVFLDLLARVFDGETIDAVELTRLRKDGTRVELNLFAAPVRRADGTIDGCISVAEDVTAHNAAARAARDSEARKSSILASALDCVITIDDAGRVVEFNPAAEETFGRTAADAIGRDLCDLIALGDADERFGDYLTGRNVLVEKRTEVTGVRSDGRRFPLDLSLTRVDVPGAPLYTAYLRDITRSRRAESRLSELETKYRTLVEQLPLVSYVNEAGPSIRTTYISPQLEVLLGYSPGEWIADQLYPDVLHPDDRERVLAAAAESRQSGQPFAGEYRLIARDGRVVSVLDETVTVFDEEGTPLFRQGFLLDITERKGAEDALRRSEALYRLVVENSHDVICLFDSAGDVQFVSPSIRETLGYEPEELIGTSFASLVHPEEAAAVEEHVTRSKHSGGMPTTARLRHKDRRWVVLEGAASVTPRESGGAPLILAVARDIKQRTRLEEQLRQAQKMDAIGRLAGGVAHDFNNLLTAIGCYSEYLIEGLAPTDPLHDDALEVKKATDRAAELTQQLLAFSRRQVLQPQVLDVNAVVADVESMLRRLIGEHVELTTHLPGGLSPIEADRGRLEQVIVNLAVNARDAMPDGGRLSISTANVDLDAAEAELSGLEAGPHVLLAVGDTGVGMDAETKARLFEPFFTTKGAGEGTGLGLATVHGIVEQRGGAIDVLSEPGRGTAFRILLPRARREADAVEPEPEDAPAATGSETVLLVEDEDLVRGLARRILAAEGYTVLEAPNDRAALELLATHTGPVDVVVTDVVMPGMNGRELAEQVMASRPEARAIMMSGYTDQALVSDETPFLAKPFSAQPLAAKVREVLDTGPRSCPVDRPRVLVVEDDEQLRKLVGDALERAGYAVLTARTPAEARLYAEADPDPIHLLLTDIFLPEVTGRTLAQQLASRRPEMQLLYTSGKPDETLLDHGVVAAGAHLLRKPFSIDELCARVGEVLAERRRAA